MHFFIREYARLRSHIGCAGCVSRLGSRIGCVSATALKAAPEPTRLGNTNEAPEQDQLAEGNLKGQRAQSVSQSWSPPASSRTVIQPCANLPATEFTEGGLFKPI